MPRTAPRKPGLPPAPDRRVVRRVLVVDDSRVQRRITVAYLRRLGLEGVEAGSGAEALECLRSGDVDMVISDWMMPGMDGIAFCRAFRAAEYGRYIYFILLTSKSEKAEVALGLDVGADDFLRKPVGLDELRARIAAGERILRMERELTRRNQVAHAALAELRTLHESIDRDLVEARKLQQSLVRERRRCFAEGEVTLLLRPTGHVGGDLVGFFRIGGEGLGLYAIDVSGHGIASALLTARLAGYLSGSTPGQNLSLGFDSSGRVVARPPEEVAARLNRLILDEVDTGHYFTMVLAVLDLRSGRVDFVQAGHPAPLLQAADGRVVRLGDGGLPVGLVAEARYERLSLQLRPGERLFLFSDGFCECPDAGGDLLGEDGMARLVEARAGETGEALLEALVWDTARHAGDAEFPDDLSAVLFEYRGPEA
jgi:sigma-B regulation protein RsbU (phosphoserine phosphatase)